MKKIKPIPRKVEQWRIFSKEVEKHIIEYVVHQYGDYPDKTIAKFNPIKVQAKIEAYVDRIGRGARGKENELRDSLKIAHFCCYLYSLIEYDDAQVIIGEKTK